MVIANARRDEAGFTLTTLAGRIDKHGAIPGVTDSARVGGGIDARTPIGFAGAATSGDVLVFARGQRGGFLDADHVVFKAEVSIDILLRLEMAGEIREPLAKVSWPRLAANS